MEIVKTIIEELIDTGTSLATPLFKAKFLAKRIDATEFNEWVDLELNGYPIRDKDTLVPTYRKHGAFTKGVYRVGYSVQEGQLLLDGLKPDLEEFCRTITLYESVTALEAKMTKKSDSTTIGMEIPPELCWFIQENIRRHKSGFSLISAQRVASAAIIPQTIT